MCQYLDPACFMVNVFAICPERNSLDFAALRDVRDHVTESLADRNVVIEWTRDSVMGALECYPDLFGSEDRGVTWRGAGGRDSVKQSFDVGFSDDFVDALRRAIQEGCAQNGRAQRCHSA